MDEKQLKHLATRLDEVNKIVIKLDPSIRAEAFAILRPYVLATHDHKEPHQQPKEKAAADVSSAETFFADLEKNKPKDNALAVAAFLYSQYGNSEFTPEQVRTLGDEVGLTLPERLDKTYLGTQRKGKNLFRRAGKGKFVFTVHGEASVKTEFKITKGRMKRSPEESE